MTFVLNQSELPKGYKARLIKSTEDEYTLRVNLKDEDDITPWIREFEKGTATQWIVRRSYPGNVKTSKEFVCHHSSHNKVKKVENGCNKRGISKNTFCQARIRISINLLGSNRSRDPFVKIGLWATIRISRQHSHSLKTTETLRFLQDNTGALREKFFEYFKNNMTPPDAKRSHELNMAMMNAKKEDYANGKLNPTASTVSYWFKQWRLLNSEPTMGVELTTEVEPTTVVEPATGVEPSTLVEPTTDVELILVKFEDETNNQNSSNEISIEELIEPIKETLVEKIRKYFSNKMQSSLQEFLYCIQQISSEEMLYKFLNAVSIPPISSFVDVNSVQECEYNVPKFREDNDKLLAVVKEECAIEEDFNIDC